MNIKLFKAVEIFTKKAQSNQMGTEVAFDLNDIFDALRYIGIVAQNGHGFAEQYMIDLYSANPSMMTDPNWQLAVTINPDGTANVQVGSNLTDPGILMRYFQQNGKNAWRMFKQDIKSSVQNHFRNNNLTLPQQPVTAIVPS